MTRHYIPLALALLLGAGASAKTITPAEALSRAGGDRSLQRQVRAKAKTNPQLIYTAETAAGDPAVYLFSNPGEGYLILSADDIAYPLLGYADKGSVDPARMAPAMRWWLEEYGRQIEWARTHGADKAAAKRNAPEGRQDIAPLIKTAWDQGEPYNKYCPVINGERTYTGCVATSMAQIMNYFQYPAVGKGSISYNDEGSGKRLSWDFSTHPFDWDNMLPTYIEGKYNDAQAEAVAILMKSTGASVKMNYEYDSSGALSVNTALALVKYFDYDPNLEFVLRSYVSSTQWDQMVYDNLTKSSPVLYGGGSMLGGGHSFIVDGYQAETGLYHLNWGWSEMSDGYFSLTALNPSALGAGGGTGGGYNFTQDGVFGIQPPTGKPVEERPVRISQFGSLGATVANDSIAFKLLDEADGSWINYTPYNLKVKFGVSIRQEGASDSTIALLRDTPLNLPTGYGAYPEALKFALDLNKLDLADGTYTFTITTLITNMENQTWQPVRTNYGSSNFVTVIKKGTRYAVKADRAPFYTVNQFELTDELYYGCLARFKYKFTNNTDFEITRGFAPVLYRAGSPAFLGDSKLITLKPGESTEGELLTEMYAMQSGFGSQISADTDMVLSIFEESSYRILTDQCAKSVVMHANPGNPSVSIDEFSIEGRDPKTGVVADASNMHVKAAITLKSGIVAYPLYAVVLGEINASGQAQIFDYFGEPAFLMNPGESAGFDMNYNFKSGVPGKRYNLMLCIAVGSNLQPVANDSRAIIPFSIGAAGVDEIGIDTEEKAEWFNIQGLPVDPDNAPAGIYIVRQGNTTRKVVKN